MKSSKLVRGCGLDGFEAYLSVSKSGHKMVRLKLYHLPSRRLFECVLTKARRKNGGFDMRDTANEHSLLIADALTGAHLSAAGASSKMAITIDVKWVCVMSSNV